MKGSISIIIVNWNGLDFLPACLRSIAANPPTLEYRVVVVDNVSSDGSREWLGSPEAVDMFSEAKFRFIPSDENFGFGRANNVAIRETESEFVFILNPDTLVKERAIDRLVNAIRSDDSIGAVSPRLLNADGTLQPSVASFPPNPFGIVLRALRLPRFFPYRWRRRFYGEYWKHDTQKAVPGFWGTAILARRGMIEKVGAFDEDFFMYGEDVEWCARINRNGWKTVFVPDAEVIHLGGKSSEQAWKASETSLKKDAADILVQEKTLSRGHRIANAVTKAGLCSLAYLRRSVLRKDRDFLMRHIRLQLRAAAEAFRGSSK